VNSRFLGDETARAARGSIGGISRVCDSRAIMAPVKYRRHRERDIYEKVSHNLFSIYIYIPRPWQKRKKI